MKNWKGPVCLFFAFSLAGTSVVAARFVSNKLGVFTIAAVSLLLAVLFLLPLCGKKILDAVRALSIREFLLLGLQAVFGIFLFRVFLLNGLLLTSSVEAGILTGATPAVTAVLAMTILREPFRWKTSLGIAATVIGIMTIQGLLCSDSGFLSEHFVGNLLIVCATASESFFNILSRIFSVKKSAVEKQAIPPLVQTALVTAIAFVLCLFPALFENPVQRLSAAGWIEWLSLAWYGIFITAVGFLFWYSGIKRCSVFTAAAFSGMMPFTSMILSVLLLHERTGWQQWLGGMLVFAGMILTGTAGASVKPLFRRNRNAASKEKSAGNP